jgi:DNA repair protein RecO (recombination protein O)
MIRSSFSHLGEGRPDIIKTMPDRVRSIRAEAIVLRHREMGEADRLLWLYTRDRGKVRAIAKGVRKIRSRKAGHLEPFTRVNLQFARGRDLLIITQAETIDAFLSIKEELPRLGYAAYVVELLDRFTYDEDENKGLYQLLVETLERLNTEADPLVPVHYFEIRMMDLLGYRPQLFKCVNCTNDIKPEDQYFSAAQGGVLCPGCGRGFQDARPVSMLALKSMRHFQRSSYKDAQRLEITRKVNLELETVLQHYLTYLLERGLNTPAFLQRVKSI